MIYFIFIFVEKKIRGFCKGEVSEIRDVVLSVIRPQISLTLAAVPFDL